MINVLHNNRCSKSREALRYLDENHIPYTVENIIENPPSPDELKTVLKTKNTIKKNSKGKCFRKTNS